MVSPTIRSTGLVKAVVVFDRNIEQANGVGRQRVTCAGHHDNLLLPTYAADAQTNDLVMAKASNITRR
jgi:hypothetical protein